MIDILKRLPLTTALFWMADIGITLEFLSGSVVSCPNMASKSGINYTTMSVSYGIKVDQTKCQETVTLHEAKISYICELSESATAISLKQSIMFASRCRNTYIWRINVWSPAPVHPHNLGLLPCQTIRPRAKVALSSECRTTLPYLVTTTTPLRAHV